MSTKSISNLLVDEPPMVILPGLAVAIGLNEAIVLQQLHYLLRNPKNGRTIDGVHYIYNTYPEWQKCFPFWSVPTVKRILRELEKMKLVLSIQPDRHDYNQRKYYTINYKAPALKAGFSEARSRKKGGKDSSYRVDQNDLGSDQIDPLLLYSQRVPENNPLTPGPGSGGSSSFPGKENESAVDSNDPVPAAKTSKLSWTAQAAAHPACSEFFSLTGLTAFPATGRQPLARAFVRRCEAGTITVRRLTLIAAVRARLELPDTPEELVNTFDDIVADARDAAQERLTELHSDLTRTPSSPLTLMQAMVAADSQLDTLTPEELFAPGMSLPFPAWLLLACCIKRGLAVEHLQQQLNARILDELAQDAGAVEFLDLINLGLDGLSVDAAEIKATRTQLLDQWTHERETLDNLIIEEPATNTPSTNPMQLQSKTST
jgi:hypothetical protein